MAFRMIGRNVVLPVVGFTAGFATFAKPWHSVDEDGNIQTLKKPLDSQRVDVLGNLAELPLYKKLASDPNVKQTNQSEKIPLQHQHYHVGQGLLYGPAHLEIDPLVFQDESKKELIAFYHLGNNLGNEKSKVHKGILALLLDEALCYCGFPSLPHKRGVTAKLDIDFHKDVPKDSTVVLRARVVENKGRKCVIKGTLESVPKSSWFSIVRSEPTIFADATCILVEPKWFKYASRINTF